MVDKKKQDEILRNWNSESLDQSEITRDQALSKIAMKLADTEEEKILTELDDRSINALTVLVSISEQFNVSTYDKLCKTFMRLKVSKKRMGRKELLEIAKSVAVQQEEGLMNKLRRRFFGPI